MLDEQGYEICERCHRRIDLEDDSMCKECSEIISKEVEAEEDV